MPTRKRKSLSSSTRLIVGAMVLGSVCAMLVPARWTAPLVNFIQWVVPFQRATVAVVDAVAPVGDADAASGAGRCDALEHANAALTARIESLKHDVQVLTATRLWDAGGRRLGGRGRLIPAQVIGEDIVPWRSSRMLAAGSRQGVRDGAAVVSRCFTVDRGEDAGVRGGLSILLGETLVGVVEHSETHSSRMKLLSDVSMETKVRIGRAGPQGFVLADRRYWLGGIGDGRMRIRDVEKRDADAGVVAVGDAVLSDPESDALPAALTVGRVIDIAVDRDNPLFAILTVQSAVRDDALRRVYIYDPQGE